MISPAVGNVLLPVIRGEGSPMKHIVKNVDILNPQSKDGPPIFHEVNPREFQIGRFFDNIRLLLKCRENEMKLSVKYVHMSQWKIVKQVLTLYMFDS